MTFGSFLFLQEQIKDIIIISGIPEKTRYKVGTSIMRRGFQTTITG
jgi:hypothetical protein